MAKQYKPGQFVWIYGKKHRVTKTTSVPVCNDCPYGKEFVGTASMECTGSCILCLILPNNCYPKPV